MYYNYSKLFSNTSSKRNSFPFYYALGYLFLRTSLGYK